MSRRKNNRKRKAKCTSRVVTEGKIQYCLETKKNQVTNKEYEVYSFQSIFGEQYIYQALNLLDKSNLLKYQLHGIDVNFELTEKAGSFILIKKPRQKYEFAYINALPEFVKLKVSTMLNLLEDNDLYKLFISLFNDIRFEGPKFRTKSFQDNPHIIYNFVSWEVLGYGDVKVASFSYTVMNDLSISRDRVLIRPLTAACHLKRLDLDKLKENAEQVTRRKRQTLRNF